MTSKALVKPNAVRRARQAHGFTQVAAAHAAGVKPAYIARIERRYPGGWQTLVRLADGLNVSTDELLGRVPPAAAPGDALARQDRDLLDAMARDAEALLGPQVLKLVGGWRGIARMAWLGLLTRGRHNDGLPRPKPPELAAVRAVEEQVTRYRKICKAKAAL